jgi:hypothetical protein
VIIILFCKASCIFDPLVYTQSMAEKKSELPSIQQLTKDAWELFKETWISYLKLIGLTIAYLFLALLIGVLISLPITFLAFGSHFQFFSNPSPFQIITIVLLGLWILLFFLSIIVIDVILPIVSIFILQGKKTTPLFDLIRQSKKFFWPFFLTLLLSGLLALGGMILLVIPGFLIAYFFAFVSYEVVIEGQKGSVALKRSYFMVKSHFWEVFGRLLVLELAMIIVSSVLGRLGAADSPLRLVQLLFSLFASWYARAYVYLLYKKVRAKTTFPAKISINWIWIVSVVGWAVFILVLVGLGVGLTHMPAAQPSHGQAIHGNPV